MRAFGMQAWYASVMMLVAVQKPGIGTVMVLLTAFHIWAQSGAVDLASDQVDVGVLGSILSHF